MKEFKHDVTDESLPEALAVRGDPCSTACSVNPAAATWSIMDKGTRAEHIAIRNGNKTPASRSKDSLIYSFSGVADAFSCSSSYSSPVHLNQTTEDIVCTSPPSSNNSLSNYPVSSGADPDEKWRPGNWLMAGKRDDQDYATEFQDSYVYSNISSFILPAETHQTSNQSETTFTTSETRLHIPKDVLDSSQDTQYFVSRVADYNSVNFYGVGMYPPISQNYLETSDPSKTSNSIFLNDESRISPISEEPSKTVTFNRQPVNDIFALPLNQRLSQHSELHVSPNIKREARDSSYFTAHNLNDSEHHDSDGTSNPMTDAEESEQLSNKSYRTLIFSESCSWPAGVNGTSSPLRGAPLNSGMMGHDPIPMLCATRGSKETDCLFQQQLWEIISSGISVSNGMEHKTILDELVRDSFPRIGKNGLEFEYDPLHIGPIPISTSAIMEITKHWPKDGKRSSKNFFRYKDSQTCDKNLLVQLQVAMKAICSRPPRRNNRFPALQLVADGTTSQPSTHNMSEWRPDISPMNSGHIPSSETRRIRNPNPPEEFKASQHSRRRDNIYDAKWVTGEGSKKAGWCENCVNGGFHLLKNSGYLYHKNHYHGIYPGGRVFEDPIFIRRKPERESKWEGLCGICYYWIDLDHNEETPWKTWFRHYKQCAHEYDEYWKLIQATQIPVRFCELEFIGGKGRDYEQAIKK